LKKAYKIGIIFYLEKRLTPRIQDGQTFYPVYVDLRLKRKRAVFRSRFLIDAPEKEIEIINQGGKIENLEFGSELEREISAAEVEKDFINRVVSIVNPFERDDFMIKGIPAAIDIYKQLVYPFQELIHSGRIGMLEEDFKKNKIGDLFDIIDWYSGYDSINNIFDVLKKHTSHTKLLSSIQTKNSLLAGVLFRIYERIITELEEAGKDSGSGRLQTGKDELIKKVVKEFEGNYNFSFDDDTIKDLGPYILSSNRIRKITDSIYIEFQKAYYEMYKVTRGQ